MSDLDYLALLRNAVGGMRDALAAADPSVRVPTCPEWTVEDLATHIVGIHRWAAAIVLSAAKQKVPDVRRVGGIPDWYVGTAAALLAALKAVDPDEPCWNFAQVEQRAGFWRRRQLHEIQIHTIDVLLATTGGGGGGGGGGVHSSQ